MLDIHLTTHTEWMRSMLEHWGFRVMSAEKDTGQRAVLIQLLQENMLPPVTPCIMHQYMDQYLTRYDHVVLFNAETPSGISNLISAIDRDRVTLITTGHIDYVFRHARILEFENFFHEQQRLYQFPEWQLDLERLTYHEDKPYQFDALLGSHKQHRDFIYQCIKYTDPGRFFCRYYRNNVESPGGFSWPRLVQKDHKHFKSALYHGIYTDIAHVVPIDIYNDSLYSIVAETYYRPGFVFVTEKTAKCLLARRLFVMFAGPGYLAHLRHRGFETFGSIIDESYDSELDDLRRWQQAWQQVQWLLAQDPSWVLSQAEPVLSHNHDRLVTGDWAYQDILHQRLRDLVKESD